MARLRPPANLQPPPGAHGWYAAWCDSRGLNVYHPERWDEATKQAYLAEALWQFKGWWRWLREHGDVDLIRQQQGRAYLIHRVKEELASALQPPPPRNPYMAGCPCHPRRLGGWPKEDKGREKDPMAIMTEGRRQ